MSMLGKSKIKGHSYPIVARRKVILLSQLSLSPPGASSETILSSFPGSAANELIGGDCCPGSSKISNKDGCLL